MKTLKKYLIVALMFGTLITNANNTESSLKDIKKVRVAFKTVKKGHVLSIKDAEGTILYSQKIEKNGTYSKTFDLSKLKKGNYTTELEKDFEIIVKSFSINQGVVVFNSEETIFKPVVRNEKNLLLISKLDFNKEPTKIALYYNDAVIFSEVAEDSNTILNRVYKLSKEEFGTYRVVIKSNNRSFSKSFNL